jgi:hypothetical protein
MENKRTAAVCSTSKHYDSLFIQYYIYHLDVYIVSKIFFYILKKPKRSTTQISNAKAYEHNFGTCDMYKMCGL